jgi:hypothetical protein
VCRQTDKQTGGYLKEFEGVGRCDIIQRERNGLTVGHQILIFVINRLSLSLINSFVFRHLERCSICSLVCCESLVLITDRDAHAIRVCVRDHNGFTRNAQASFMPATPPPPPTHSTNLLVLVRPLAVLCFVFELIFFSFVQVQWPFIFMVALTQAVHSHLRRRGRIVHPHLCDVDNSLISLSRFAELCDSCTRPHFFCPFQSDDS